MPKTLQVTIIFLSILTLNGKLPTPCLAYCRCSIHSDASLLHPTSHHCQLLSVPESPHCAPSRNHPGPSTISPSYRMQCPFKWTPAPEPCSPQQLGDSFQTCLSILFLHVEPISTADCSFPPPSLICTLSCQPLVSPISSFCLLPSWLG